MMRYYQDRWTGDIHTQRELWEMVEHKEVARYQIGRRFRALPSTSCRLLQEAAQVAARAERQYRTWPGP